MPFGGFGSSPGDGTMAARTFIRFGGTIAAMAALAACSAAGTGIPAAQMPAAAHVDAPEASPIQATLRIAIPRRSNRGHYVSPATKSIAIAI